ncbi:MULTISPECIES: alpha/beta hydrolase family protein [Pseudomonas]|uniref:alpha/beta hydrolase family protein n=1 Tax=Pseudomonas TaxID=286 RepID=UPI0023616B46|nr:prolyl oligopeptidase family serine peptidase [Pseudomonas asplenii]
MPARFKPLIAILLCALLHGLNPAYAANEDADAIKMPQASMNERVLTVPGDSGRPVPLQLTVLTPNGPGPFPLAVMNHGSDGSKKPRDNPRYHLTFSAYYFLSRGYAVALPMMRGFAGSGGQFEHHGCDFISTGLNNARDIRAVIQYMTAQPYVDGQHIVVAGQSFGGFNTLALGALDVPNVKGLINFAGGLKESDCATSEHSMAAAAAYDGEHTRIPSIWFYGSNDKVFAESTWRNEYARYTAAGGAAELVAYGNFMDNSHNLLGFPEGLAIWTPKVDAFLSRVGLPAQLLHPEYLPVPVPPPSRYAALEDAGAVPYINDQSRKVYQQFLTRALPRVFLIAGDGSTVSTNGGFDPLGRGLAECRKVGRHCRPYAVDNEVVWVKPVPVPPPTHFAALEDATAVPYISIASQQGYRKFLGLKKPRAFTIAPDGAWSASAGGNEPLQTALDICASAHQGCRPYAVNDDVVWSKQ